MSLSINHAKHASIILISCTAIALSAIYVSRSLRRPDVRPGGAVDTRLSFNVRDATPRDKIPMISDLVPVIRERLLASGRSGSDLEDYQIEVLSEQIGSLLIVESGGGVGEYVSLMERWGGRHDLSAQDLDMIASTHLAPTDPLSIASYGIAAMSLDARASTGRPTVTAGGESVTTHVAVSQFRFHQHWSDLLEERRVVASVRLPVRLNNNDDAELRYELIWSPDDARWIPYMKLMLVPEGHPMSLSIY